MNPALQCQHPICTQHQPQVLYRAQKAEQPSKQGKLSAAKPQQSPEELERLREARAKAAESRAKREEDILGRLAAERKEAGPLSLNHSVVEIEVGLFLNWRHHHIALGWLEQRLCKGHPNGSA